MRISGPSTYILYAKFAMKLSATVTPRWEGVVKQHIYRDFELKLIYNVVASKPPIQPV